MEILFSVVAKIAEYTVAPIGRQVRYLLFYKDNFKELEEAMNKLKDAEDRIKHLVESERRNGKIIENVVQNWQDGAQKITGEANQLFEDPRNAKVGCSNWSFPDLRSRHQLSRKATKMAKTIADVLAGGKFEKENIGYLPPLDGVGSTFAARGCQKIDSRVSMMMEILSALTDPNVSKMGIYGLGGVGKTTLVKQVAAKAEEDKLFDAVVMANITQSPDLQRIQGEIADLLGLQFNEETVFGRAFRLRKRIEQEKTILIILDDIWERLDLEEVGIPVEDDHKGCKVLMTSRTQDALRKMGTQKDFRLEILTEEETWSLFKLKAEVDHDPSLQYIATEVAKKCAGLPVLIVTVASALKKTDIHSWNDALNQLESIDSKEMHEVAYTALELSYSRLESDELKALFLLCGLLGGHPLIRDLLKYGMGLGIFKHINTVRDARNRLHKMISTLKSSCLLLGYDTITNVEMHDIVRDVAISIASRDQHVFTVKNGSELKDWPSEDLLERCPYIILIWCHIHKIPEKLDCPKLKLFHLNSGYNRSLQIPDSFFEGMGNLKVLDVTNMDMSSLPTSFHSLTNVKTLCLDHCTLVDIAAIGALKDLEVLSLIKSSIAHFPSEIRLLTHLRMLDLTGSGIEVIPPNIISNLTRLEELYMGNTSIKWEPESSANQNKNASLAELKQLPNLIALDIQIREAWVLPRDLMFEKLERYKIFIGDVWEWSGKYETSKTLKLKLHTSIHLEHGIKLLIKRVEDLYLDELNGISNVLFQLNGEGFPHLKHLYIQNNAEIKHIINSMEWTQSQDSFPKLETLVLHNLNNLEKISHGALMVNSFSNLKIIKVKSCDRLRYLLPSSMADGLSQVLEIEVSECKSMKTIVLVDSDTNVDRGIMEFYKLRSLTLQSLLMLDDFYFHELESSTTMLKCKQSVTYIPMPLFSKKVAFPNLETLKLSAINLKKIWDDDQLSAITSIQNLTYLIVEDCGALKYLFSSLRIATFPKLKWLEISKCHMMEEIIVTEEGANNNVFIEVGLSKLEKIIIKDMQNLKTIWHPQHTASSFGKLKTLEVKSCPKLVNIFPSYMQRKFSNLETLTVSDCDSMEEIFQLEANETCSEEDTTELKSMTLLRLPKLKQIWSREPQGILRFHNLQAVSVKICYNLVYLFPFSVATNLLQLEELFLNACGITYIVAKKEGPMEGTAIFVLNGLKSFDIRNLQKLKGFYAGIHTLACSSLKSLNVFNCNKLKLFKTLSTRQRRSPDDTVYEQPLFTVEEVIPNLEELTLNNEDSNMILEGQFLGHLFSKLKLLRVSEFENEEATFPYWFLQNIPTLERIVVQSSSFKEIFRDEKRGGGEGQIESSTQLKKLTLAHLPELQRICKEGSKIDPVLEVLETFLVMNCSGLTNLFPSSVTLSHLTYLEITNCNGLINITTCSAMRSLVKLRTMKIKECNSVEEIVSEKEDEAKEKIIFGALKILELVCLPKLNRFCSSKCLLRFQLLETVIVRQCPRMNTFSKGSTSALKLRKVQIEESDVGWCWEGDLNGTISKMFTEKVAFQNMKHLRLVEYPELKELWYGKLPPKIFGSLKSLVVQKCDFLADTLFPSNLIRVLQHLEEIEVRDCDLLEAVFEIEVTDDKKMQVKEITQLKKLTLAGLPRLKHVWRKDPKGTLSFQNLCIVNVANCKSLESLIRTSIARELVKLEELEVVSCGIEEIVAREEGANNNVFTEVGLSKLEKIIIKDMQNLKTIWHPQHTASSFGKLKTLKVKSCPKLVNIFPSYMQRKFSNLETLTVSDCDSMEEIFQLEANETCSEEDTTELKSMTLLRLPKLKQIWSREPQGILRFHNLQAVSVKICYNLVYLFPFSVATNLLQLEELFLNACGITYIVAKKEGPMEGTAIFVLNGLKSFDIRNLQKLKGFYAGIHTLACSSLKSLNVFNCNKLKLFKTLSTRQRRSPDDTVYEQPLFTVEEVIPNLEELTLNNEDSNMILEGQFLGHLFSKLKLLRVSEFENEEATFPYWFLQNIPTLERIVVQSSSFKEIFRDEKRGGGEGQIESSTQLKKLTLAHLPELQRICKEGSKIDPVLEVLETFLVMNCSGLTNLFPSSVTLSHLTYLEITNCNGLINITTCSAMRSLVKLRTMKIKECNSVEEIVSEKEDEAKEEIIFGALKILELVCLPKLNRFCSSKCLLRFQLLETVIVRQCPRMNTFSKGSTSALKLRKVQIEESDVGWCWEGDLNGTISKMFTEKVAFQNMKHLRLVEYPELKELWYGKLPPKIFGSLKSLVVQKCDFLADTLFPSNLIRVLQHLEEIEVRDCDLLEAVFEIEVTDDKKMQVKEITQLKKLTLAGLPRLKHVWRKDPKGTLSFQNLCIVNVANCKSLESLIRTSIARELVKLEELEVVSCGIEEIVARKEGANNNVFIEVGLPKLEKIIIKDMQNLKTIWHPQLTASSFGKLKTLEVKSCPKLVNIFPSYMQRKFSNLETLTVSDCDSMEEIFQLDANETCSEEDTTELKSMTLLRLPKLKQIWSRDPQGILRFHNLQAIRVEDCYNLVYLFPFSVATNLLQLEELFLNGCGITYIVAKKEGPMEGTPIFVLNGLKSFDIRNLQKLKGFYAGIHTLACSSLKEINVFNCNKLKLFKTLSTRQRRSPDDTVYEQPLFTVGEVIPNLEMLTLNNEDTNMILQGQFSGHLFSKLKFLLVSKFENEEATFPYWFLQNIPTLETIVVEFSSFKEIFQDEKLGGEEGKIESSTQLKKLTLSYLPELQHICKEGSKIDPVLEVLEGLLVSNCSGLTNLFPSSVTLSHLTYLEIRNCNGLINLITCSAMRSLVKLRTMKIKECNSVEEIVSEKEDEAKEEIIFGALEILELVCLPKLNRFCSSKCLLRFQLLETVVVRQCPRMNTFSKGSTSALKLRKVQIEESDVGWCWEGDLNGTIIKMFTEKVAFHGFKHLELFEYSELKELWYGSYGQGGHQIFSNLKSLGVKKCDFLSDVLFPSNLLQVLYNLEELEVTECVSLEALIDVEGTNGKEMQMKETSQLKRLKLSGLPNLKHIWNKDHHGIISFRNLLMVHAVNCESLKNLFPVSLSKDLVQLQELDIESCGLVEIFAKEEGLEECSFDFPQMTKLRLWSLTKLKCFYPGRHTLDCPSLMNLTIYHCGALQTFAFDHSDLNFQQANGVCKVDIPEVLFTFDKVCPKLEQLALNGEDVMTIRNGHYQKTLFHKIEHLRLQCFHETQVDFPNDFLQRFPNLVLLIVRCSSFETLFPLELVGPLQIRELFLFKLEQLKYIWGENSMSQSLPSSISFKNLTVLEVEDCKRLMYLITSSIAKILLPLTSIKINNCERIEDAVKNDEEAEEIITFQNLEYLELTSLSSLRSFCSGKQTFILPSLVELVVTGCPKMKTFSSGVVIAPMLQSVTMENEKKYWKGDLNTTIQQLFKCKETINSLCE